MVKFKAKIWDMHASNVLTVPKQYVKDGAIKSGKEYIVEITEVEDEQTTSNAHN